MKQRDRLALALDTDDSVHALRLARECVEYFAYVKIGLELFFAEGPSIIYPLKDLGYRIFLDLKLHDIPNTVYRSAKVVAGYGVDLLTVHSDGGIEMLQACVRGLSEGAATLEIPVTPKALAITYLTSQKEVSREQLNERLEMIAASGVAGFVSSAHEVEFIKRVQPNLFGVVPGIRFEGDTAHDQARVATPGFAIAAGADLLVIGRSITAARNLDDSLATLRRELG